MLLEKAVQVIEKLVRRPILQARVWIFLETLIFPAQYENHR
jgi:hypothetical protein